MRYLLDTQVFLWYLADSRRLGSRARGLIEQAQDVFVSAASVWEISIKAGIGKLDVDVPTVVQGIEASGFRELSVSARHAASVASLPRHHADPFDRLLVAQALYEPLHLLTADDALTPYSDLVVQVA